MGARPGDTGRIQDVTLVLPTTDPLLGSSKHGNEGKRIVWGPLHGVPGFHPGGPYPPPPRIFNVVVDVIFCHWVVIVTENKTYPDVFLYLVVEKAEFLYANYGPIACLQWFFKICIRIFERVGIRNSAEKTVTMVCHPRPIVVQHSDAAYRWSTNGKGDPHCVNQRLRVVCG